MNGEDVLVSSLELRRIAATLEANGRPPRVIKGERTPDYESFLNELRLTVPLDPPLTTGNSLNAMSDSIGGGLYVDTPAPIMWDAAWIFRDAKDGALFEEIVDVFRAVQRTALLPAPAGLGIDLTVLVADRP